MRRMVALLVCLPLAVGGVLIAHQASYGLVAPDAHARQHLLEHTGHGYLEHLPLVVATLVTLVLAGLAGDAIRIVRGGCPAPALAWTFAVLAPAGFVVQEHLERLIHDGVLPLDAWHQPTLLLGVLLQLPVSVLAWLVALTLLRTTPRIAAAMAVRPRSPQRRAGRPNVAWERSLNVRPRLAQLASCAAGRAPPVAV
jgi:hypothetical protein